MIDETREERIERLKEAQKEEWDEDRGLLILLLEEEPREDCISRQAVIDMINSLPTVYPTKPTARWTLCDKKWGGGCACNYCGRLFKETEPYCGNCGRRMLSPERKVCET